MTLSGDIRKAIDSCFAYDNIDSIFKALDSVASQGSGELKKWAEETKKTILERSPTSVKVTLKQMQLGRNWTIDHALQREYHIAAVFMDGHDFNEGVSAKLIRKPAQKPQWQPANLNEVTMDEVDRYFAVKGQDQLQLYNRGPGATYLRYPHGWIGLPTERDVELVVQEGGKSRADVVKHFIKIKEGKLGVKEKVSEILDRKTRTDAGALTWDSSAELAHDSNITRGSRDPINSGR